MTNTTTLYRCLRSALGGFLTAATIFLFATAACGQVNQCIKGKINSEECWVGLEVSGSSVIVTPSDVALYSDSKISWKRTDTANPSQPDFAVDFDSTGCTPFRGAFHFDQSTPAPIADELPGVHFELCKYKAKIGNLTADAQVIVVGGPKRHTTSWSKRHFGDW